MGPSQNSYTFDALTELADGAANTTSSEHGQVGAADKTLDFGGGPSGATTIAYTPGDLVLDVSAIDFTTADETYEIHYQLTNNSDFATLDVFSKAAVMMGDARSGFDDDTASGRVVVGVDNQHKGVLYQYARLWIEVAGDTPIINVRAFLSRNQ